MIRNLLPRTHWSTYERDGAPRLAIWRQWLHRTWNAVEVRLADGA
jgi:hypothetical protein